MKLNPFARLTLQGVIAPLTKVTAELNALKEQNAADVATKNATIAQLNTEVAGHQAESQTADAVLANINALLAPVKSS